jgi:hypothetical protein
MAGAQASSLPGLPGFDKELFPEVQQARQRGCLRSQGFPEESLMSRATP